MSCSSGRKDSQTIRTRHILFIVSNFKDFMDDDYKPLKQSRGLATKVKERQDSRAGWRGKHVLLGIRLDNFKSCHVS